MTEKPSRLAAYWERQLDKLDELERRRAAKLPSWRTRRRRRRLALLLGAADLGLVAAAAIFKTAPAWTFFVLWFAVFAVGGVAFGLLRILTGRMNGGFSRLLDEREREWRHRITFVGYQVLIFLMIVAMFYAMAVADRPEGGWRAAMMLSALLVTGTTIPSIVLGWALPDDDPEDFEEGMDHD
ncbi:hypothetical protein [Amycolatopsis sp. NPDC051128]|uniref:hypothetical protein n=1 Tax=Amycolatopsis sp. NPDC051128 TaxID=3155412 RepID=UPI003416451E